jgi:enoyl-CoA hydratase/carnithine racemase
MDSVIFNELTAQNGKLIGVATLNAEKSLNALNLEMIDLLFAQLTQWQQNDSVSMVVLEGAGDKAFCAGGDVVSLYNAMKSGEPTDNIKSFFSREYRLDYLIHTYDKPLCVWGNGIIMGGGLGLMAGASHRVVTESARIAMPEITIGLYPDVGGSYFLNKMPDQVGLFLGLTGASVNALDALFVGLADTIINHDKKSDFTEQLIAQSWDDDPQHNHQILSQLLTVLNQSSDFELECNVESHSYVFKQMQEAESLTSKVDTILAIESNEKWLLRAQKTLKNGSPLSTHLVYQQLERAKHLSLADCFKMELGMSVFCGEFGEFQEGVRALLIDKDNSPNWHFNQLETVDPDVVERFFNYDFGAHHPLEHIED